MEFSDGMGWNCGSAVFCLWWAFLILGLMSRFHEKFEEEMMMMRIVIGPELPLR